VNVALVASGVCCPGLSFVLEPMVVPVAAAGILLALFGLAVAGWWGRLAASLSLALPVTFIGLTVASGEWPLVMLDSRGWHAQMSLAEQFAHLTGPATALLMTPMISILALLLRLRRGHEAQATSRAVGDGSPPVG
jgi:hypothetical protein